MVPITQPNLEAISPVLANLLVHENLDQFIAECNPALAGLIDDIDSDDASIKIYSALDDNERAQYKAEYPQEEQTMTSLTERLRAEGMEKGMAQGMEQGMEQGMARGMTQGERTVLTRQLQRRFGPLDAQSLNRLEAANQQQLELWAERVLEADSLADFFQEH